MKNHSASRFLIFILLIVSLNVSCYAQKSVPASDVKIPEVKAGQPLPSDLFIQLAKNVSPSVVNIYTETSPKLNYSEGMPDSFQMFLEQFFGQNIPRGGGNGYQGMPKAKPAQSLGTGFIIKSDGLILTNAHVVNGADVIKVLLAGSDDEHRAEVVGADTQTDVALIKIKSKKPLPAAKLGTSKDLEVGEWVAAFGNPYGHSNTMTKGIVSALGRDSGGLNLFPFIQTDASINPGNSGGPLVNVKGEVIGMNTAIDARAQGIGFAIPIDNVKKILAELEKTGQVQRGFLGVEMQGIDEMTAQQIGVPVSEGALIVNVLPNSAASKAGLKPYDVVVKIGDNKVTGPSDLAKAVGASAIGESMAIEVYRNGKKITLNTTIGSKQKEVVSTDKKQAKPSESFDLESVGLRVSKSNGAFSFKADIGVHIDAVKPYSPAFSAGLQAGDIILEINKTTVNSPGDVKKLIQKKNIFRIQRGQRIILLMLILQ